MPPKKQLTPRRSVREKRQAGEPLAAKPPVNKPKKTKVGRPKAAKSTSDLDEDDTIYTPGELIETANAAAISKLAEQFSELKDLLKSNNANKENNTNAQPGRPTNPINIDQPGTSYDTSATAASLSHLSQPISGQNFIDINCHAQSRGNFQPRLAVPPDAMPDQYTVNRFDGMPRQFQQEPRPALVAQQAPHLDYHNGAAFMQPPRPAMTQYQHDARSTRDLTHSQDLAERLTRALTEPALQTENGKYPHNYIVRGQKRSKTGLGELNATEYLWGLYQLLGDTQEGVDKEGMRYHYQRVLKNSTTYAWECVRNWSESVFYSINNGSGIDKLTWSNRYGIDQLENELAKKTPISEGYQKGEANPSSSASELVSGYYVKVPSFLAQKRPGPPCSFYNSGSCNQPRHHAHNGYKQLHVCSWCISNRAMYQEHKESECNFKQNNVQNPNKKPGFHQNQK